MSDLRPLWERLRRWLWLIVLGTVAASGAGYAFVSNITPTYEAQATLMVNQAQGTAAVASYDDLLSSERLARTYGELMRTGPVLDRVIAELQLPTRADELAKSVDVKQVRDTQLISLSVEHPDPAVAAQIANTIATTFIAQVAHEQVGQTASTREIMSRQIAELEAQMKRTSDAITTEQARIDQARVGGVDVSPARLGVLQSELAQYQTTYAQMLRSQHEMALQEAKAANSLRLAVPATPPERPSRPNVPQRTGLAAVVGLLLCAALAFLLEYLNDSVRTAENVERTTGLHTLGSVALLGRGRRRGSKVAAEAGQARVLVSDDPRSVHSEAFRMLRANIEFAQVDRECRTMMVTSPNPGEGKSTVAVNLATVMAQAGRRVLLVDADLRRPTVHHTLGLDNRRGLTTLLAQGGDPIDVVQATDLPGFIMVMTSGPIPPNPAELLGSARMTQVLAKMADMVDLVILDTPPVLAVADPAVLAGRVDGVTLVVDAGRTSVEALRRTRDTLARASANVLGVVLNRLDTNSGGYYQQYYAEQRGRTSAEPDATTEPVAPTLSAQPSAAGAP
jgi:succinoglycan biosynthesis transport protein ExoP